MFTNRSDTKAGLSTYLDVFDNRWDRVAKIRISDHSVTSDRRILSEYHVFPGQTAKEVVDDILGKEREPEVRFSNEKPVTPATTEDKKRINSNIDKTIALVSGISVKEAKEQRVSREQVRKQDAAELYARVLNSQFDDITLQLLDKYIDDGTPKNPYGNRISKRLPQEVERSLYAQSRTAKVDALLSRICEAAVGSARRALPSERLKIQQAKNSALKAWAIATGNWHTNLSAFTNDKEPFASGTDSDVFLSKDGEYAIKASKGKSSAKKFAPDLDNIPLNNYIFPNTAYEILGYGETDGKFIRILKQPYVDFDKSRKVSVDERVQFMHDLGFEPINKDKTVFSNRNLVVADLQKSNIVYDKLHTKDVGGDYTYPPVVVNGFHFSYL